MKQLGIICLLAALGMGGVAAVEYQPKANNDIMASDTRKWKMQRDQHEASVEEIKKWGIEAGVAAAAGIVLLVSAPGRKS